MRTWEPGLAKDTAMDGIKAQIFKKMIETGVNTHELKIMTGFDFKSLDFRYPQISTIVKVCDYLGMDEVTIRWR